MRQLTDREKRTVKIASVALVAYLILFYGMKGWGYLREKKAEYDQTQLQIDTLSTRILRERAKAKKLESLRKEWKLDLTKQDPETLVGETRECLLKAAAACGVALGPSRENPGRIADAEQARIQIDGSGDTAKVILFLDQLKKLGVPLLIDHLEIRANEKKPGKVSLSASLALLSFDAWKGPAAAPGEGV